MDQHRELWDITPSDLDQFRPQDPEQPFHLDPAPLRWPHFVEDWNLVVPAAVVERQWELVLTPPTRRELNALAADSGFVAEGIEKAVRLLAAADDVAHRVAAAGSGG